MIIVGHLTFIANVTGFGLNVRLFLLSLGVYLVVVFSIAGRSLWRFRLPRTAA